MTPSSPADDPNTIRGPVSLGSGMAPPILDALTEGTLRVVHKPWGHEMIIETSVLLLKLIVVDEDHQTSLQHHEVKDEVQWVLYADGPSSGVHVYSGQDDPRIYPINRVTPHVFRAGEHVRVRPGTVHRTVGPCMLIEVTTIENDDVVRHEDDYNRAATAQVSEAGWDTPPTGFGGAGYEVTGDLDQ